MPQLLPPFEQGRRAPRARRWPFSQRRAIPWIVLVASLVITGVGTWGVYDRVQAHDADRMIAGREATTTRIEMRLERYNALLSGASGLVSAVGGDDITADAFRAFASRLEVHERYPGVEGIGYSRRVRPGGEAAVLETLRHQGMDAARVWPVGADEAHAILFLEPLDARNSAALGFNMFSDATHRAAMVSARDAGRAALSGRVMLKQEVGDDVQTGFLLFVPVYRGGTVPPTTEGRREALEGFVYAPFRADDLFEDIYDVAKARPPVAFRIYDGRTMEPEHLLHDSRDIGIPSTPGAAYRETEELVVDGRVWTVALAPTVYFGDASRRWLAPIVGIIGGFLSVLLFSVSRAQVQAEAAARERERQFRTTLESLPVGVFVAERDGRIAFANAAVERTFMGDGPVGEHDVPRFATWWSGVVGGFAERHEALTRALRGDEDMSEIVEVRAFDGSARTLLVAAFPLHGAGGVVERAVAAVVDLTEQRRAREAEAHAIRESVAREAAEAREAQLRRHAAELERSNRELQDFAYVASHDLQEPLRKISAFSDLLRAEHGAVLPDSGRDYLDRMQAAALRMSQLIKDLLAFSRVTTRTQPFGPVDLDTVLDDVLLDVALRLEESGGHVEAEPLPTVYADPTQMRQLLLNLVGNALKFHRPGVPPAVRIRGSLHAGDAEEAPLSVAGSEERSWCRLEIEDNGIGFDEKYLDRIFTPFQRLHGRDAYDGTGMGLAICRRIVERHEGVLEARSTPGAGSTFVVRLPVRPASTPAEAPASTPAATPAETEPSA